MFGLRRQQSTDEAGRFDPARVELDHFGFHLADRQQLEAWRAPPERRGPELDRGGCRAEEGTGWS
jgi:hypothetical protein